MEEIKEGSTSYHPLSFTGRDGEEVTPESIRYRVRSVNRVDIIPWTQLDVDSKEIEVSAESNTIGDVGKGRVLTIEVTHNGGKKITEEIQYSIVDLQGIP